MGRKRKTFLGWEENDPYNSTSSEEYVNDDVFNKQRVKKRKISKTSTPQTSRRYTQYTEEAFKVLSESKVKMTALEIVNVIIAKKVLKISGKFPARNLAAQILKDIRTHETKSRFIKVAASTFALRHWEGLEAIKERELKVFQERRMKIEANKSTRKRNNRIKPSKKAIKQVAVRSPFTTYYLNVISRLQKGIKTHENRCLICKGVLLLNIPYVTCSQPTCLKVYHMHCLMALCRINQLPTKILCPIHFCCKCSKPSTEICCTCCFSYCKEHKDKTKWFDADATAGKKLCEKCKKSINIYIPQITAPLTRSSKKKKNLSSKTVIVPRKKAPVTTALGGIAPVVAPGKKNVSVGRKTVPIRGHTAPLSPRNTITPTNTVAPTNTINVPRNTVAPINNTFAPINNTVAPVNRVVPMNTVAPVNRIVPVNTVAPINRGVPVNRGAPVNRVVPVNVNRVVPVNRGVPVVQRENVVVENDVGSSVVSSGKNDKVIQELVNDVVNKVVEKKSNFNLQMTKNGKFSQEGVTGVVSPDVKKNEESLSMGTGGSVNNFSIELPNEVSVPRFPTFNLDISNVNVNVAKFQNKEISKELQKSSVKLPEFKEIIPKVDVNIPELFGGFKKK